MTFGHKAVQRRLVALLATSLAVTFAVQSCELPQAVDTTTPPAVAQVVVTPPSATVQAGEPLQLTATPEDAAGNPLAGRTITWSSTNTGVVTVDGSGLVTAVSAGSATITATSEGQVGSATITVTAPPPVPVASVTVSPTTASVAVGGTLQLTATPRDANGTALAGRAVTWASHNTTVATVSASGLVTGVVAGTATITATSEGQSGTSAITVTAAPVPVASVDVTPASASVDEGKTVQLTATPKDANGTPLSGRVVTWVSSNTSVATVSAGGLVTGKVAGSATITATSEGKSGSSAITVVVVPVASVTVAPPAATVQAGSTTQLTATPKDASGNPLAGRTVTWTSDNAAVATVSATGLVTGVVAGTATITATSEGRSGTSAITVTAAPVPVASVDVTPASASVDEGKTVQLTATPKDANGTPLSGRAVTWVSSNTTVATVSAGGLVTGKVAGSATITATSEGKSGSSAVTVVRVPVASVSVTPATGTVQVGSTMQLTATPRDASGSPLSGRTITWSSSNTGIASVTGSGVVRGVAVGSATITATSEGQSGTAAITVQAPPPPGTAPFGHVFIVTEENHNYASVIGSSSMPYLNGLAQQYGLATQYYANTHPSIGNYFMLATGQIITNNDGFSTIVTVDNVVRQLRAAGKTWKSYAEGLPSVGFTGATSGRYARKHNVFALLSDVVNDPVQVNNLVPFTQFATDLTNGTLPDYSNIVPDLCNDAHDCPLATADTWLKNNIDPLIQSATFQQDGLLIIVFDEAGSGDATHGGGRIAWVAVSPKAKRGYQSTTLYQHQSTLRLTLQGLGVTVFPGAAASAPDMNEFFTP